MSHLTPSEAHEIYIGKMVSIPLMFILVFGSCLLPYALSRLKRARTIIAFATCLSAGAMLGIGLLHTFPESREVFEHYFEGGHDHDHDHDHGHDDHDHDHKNFTRPIVSSQGKIISEVDGPNWAVDLELLDSSSNTFRYTHSTNSTDDHGHGHSHGEEGHVHPYPYVELCAGLAILVLFVTEHLVTAFLEMRGSTIAHCHGHSHAYLGDHEMGDIGDDEKHEHHHGVHNTHDPCTLENGSESAQQNTDIAFAENSSSSVNSNTTTFTPTDASKTTSLLDDTDDDEVPEDPEVLKARQNRKRNVDAFISAAAICIHCIFNGLSLGAEKSSPAQFWTFFVATVAHKCVDGLAVGVPIYRAQLPIYLALSLFVLVAASSPIGVAIGYAVASNAGDSLAQAVIMALSGGSFIFVAVFEMLPAGFSNRRWILLKCLFVFIGFAVVAVVAKWA